MSNRKKSKKSHTPVQFEKKTKSPVKVIENDEEDAMDEANNQRIEEEHFHQHLHQELTIGDIFVVIKVFDDIAARENVQLTEEMITKIGDAITKYAKVIFVPLEVAENFLNHLNLMFEASHIQNKLHSFAANSNLVNSLILVISQYCLALLNQEPVQTSFLTHSCYEKTLFIFLGLIETPANLQHLLVNIPMDNLRLLFSSLGKIIELDTLYLSQELALEILARICLLMIHHLQKVQTLTEDLIEPLKIALTTSKERILTVLGDMRPLLTEINQNNFSIESYHLEAIEATVGIGTPQKRKLNLWLDLCQELWCIQIIMPSVFVKSEYKSIQSVISYPDSLYLQITISNPPANLLQLWKMPKSLTIASLNLYFNSTQEMDAAKSFLDQKLYQIRNEEKLSVATTKGRREIKVSKDTNSPFFAEKVALGLNVLTTSAEESISTISSPNLKSPEKLWNQRQALSLKIVNEESNDPLISTGIEGSKSIIPRKPKRAKMTARVERSATKLPKAVAVPLDKSDIRSSTMQSENNWNFEPSFFEVQPESILPLEENERSKSTNPNLFGSVNEEEKFVVVSKKIISDAETSEMKETPSVNRGRKRKQPMLDFVTDKENILNTATSTAAPQHASGKQSNKKAALRISAVTASTVKSKNSGVRSYEQKAAKDKSIPASVPKSGRKEDFVIYEDPIPFVDEKERSAWLPVQSTSSKPFTEEKKLLNLLPMEPLAVDPLVLQKDSSIKKPTPFKPTSAEIAAEMKDVERKNSFPYENSEDLSVSAMDVATALSPAEINQEAEFQQQLQRVRDLGSKMQSAPIASTVPELFASMSDFISENTEFKSLSQFTLPSAPTTSAFNPPKLPPRKSDSKKYQLFQVNEKEDTFDRGAGLNEDDDVISILMMEIVAMQKQRAKRKRSRQLSTIASNAETQLLQFSQQWFEYTESLLYDANDSLSVNLQNLLQHHLTPLENSMKDLISFKSHYEVEHDNHFQSLQNDLQSLMSEIHSFHDQRLKEKKHLFTEIEQLRKACYDNVEKEIYSQNINTSSSSFRNKRDDLLRQLDSL